MALENTDSPIDERLKTFFESYREQLAYPQASLVFPVRPGDDQVFIQERIQKVATQLQLDLRAVIQLSRSPDLAEFHSSAVLSDKALQTILKRAQEVFQKLRAYRESDSFKIVEKGISVYLWPSAQQKFIHTLSYPHLLQLRPGDRVALTPSGRALEDVLFELAQETGIPYMVKGKRSPSSFTPHYADSLQELASCVDDDLGYIPFPLAEALYRGEMYELRHLYDQRDPKSSLEGFLAAMKNGACFIIVEYRDEKKFFHLLRLKKDYVPDHREKVYEIEKFPLPSGSNFNYILQFFPTSWRNSFPASFHIGMQTRYDDGLKKYAPSNTAYEVFGVFPKASPFYQNGSGSPYR